jgi:subtilisin family serine protease
MNLKKQLLIIIGTMFLFSSPVFATGQVKKFKKGEILIKYKDSALKKDPRERYSRTNRTARIKTFKKSKVEYLKLPQYMTVEQAVKNYQSNPDIEFAEPNYVYGINVTPDDEFFNNLWSFHNTGQSINSQGYGTADADIDAPDAWDMITDASDVIVAVVDSGVDYNHPDLSANIWINTQEIPDNGIDDDGNGRIDDVRGWDFVNNENGPMDQNGHGTHVSGTIGAVGDNFTGVPGTAWHVKLMPVRGLGADGYGYTSDLIDGIEYADANGADIINLSWGGENNSVALKTAINASQALFVCAAGNDGDDTDITPHYPASFDCPNIISVAATDFDDELASFSNYGATSVDVCAPGVDIYSTLPARKIIFQDNFDDGDMNGWTTGGTNNSWAITNSHYESPPYALDEWGSPTQPAGESWIQSPALDLSAETMTTLSCMLDVELNSGDYVVLEISSDGTNWTEVERIEFSVHDFFSATFDLSQLDGSSTAFFRIKAVSGSGNYYRCYIDDIVVSSFSDVYDNSEYAFMNGTSMAAPYVSGIAALIKAKSPTADASEIKSAVEYSVEEPANLAGKTVSNGRVNAYKALLNFQTKYFDISRDHRVNSYTTDSQINPSTVSLDNGNVVVVWATNDQDNSLKEIHGQLLTPSGQKVGSEFRVNSTIDYDQHRPQVIKLSDGRFCVVWLSGSSAGDGPGYYGQLFNQDGSMAGGEFIVRLSGGSLSIGALDTGGFIAAWADSSFAGGLEIMCQAFDNNGLPVGSEFHGNNPERSDQKWPLVTTFSNGDFLITWQSKWLNDRPVTPGIYGQIFDNSRNKINDNFLINNNTDYYLNPPEITALPDGKFVVLSYASSNLRMQVFEHNGTPFSQETIVNPTINNRTYSLTSSRAIESVSNGYFLVTSTGAYEGEAEICALVFNQNGGQMGEGFIVNIKGDSGTSDITGTTDNSFYIAHDGGYAVTSDIFGKVIAFQDTDSDHIPDNLENEFCTFFNDADSDDDGILDGLEDKNANGILDAGETDPCNVDTDGDGIQDGTELGLTLADITPDTDTNIFQPDLDPTTTTDPLSSDSDNDAYSDGDEDKNHNGRVDQGETNPADDASKPMGTLPFIPLLLFD